jgi:uncharacterized protein YggE
MNKFLLLLPASALFVSCGVETTREIAAKERTITVTGAADTKLCPDEMTLTIEIAEYYKEKYEAGKTEKDYKTLVKLEDIEKSLMELLHKNGVNDSSISFSFVNTTWQWYYYDDAKKPVTFQKTISVKLKDHNKVVSIIRDIDTKGVAYLSVGDFRSSKEQEMRKELKAEALKAAKEKASYMLSKVDKQIGEIVSIREINDEGGAYWSWRGPAQTSLSNTSYDYEDSSPAGPQDITMRYEVEAEFEIE